MKDRSPKRNFHIPLSDETYRELRMVARESGEPATRLARQAIEFWLNERKKDSLHKEIAAYATAVAGQTEDLDEDLEAAGVEFLLKSDDRKRRSK